jgi:hypothetical protein
MSSRLFSRNETMTKPNLIAPAAAAAALVLAVLGAFPKLFAGEGDPAGAAAMTRIAAEQAVLDTVAPVEEIRGLTFKQAVSVTVVSDETVRRHATDRLRKFYSDGEILAQQEAYVALGLLPEGTDVLQEYLEVLEEQAGGFYDPGTKSFFLLDDMPAAAAPMLAAHELTHALEDQYFDLDAQIEQALPDEDRAFAVGAVHEGSAMLVMSVYVARGLAEGNLTQEGLEAMGESEASRGERLEEMPPALQRSFLGAYVLGMSFLTRGDLTRISQGFPVEDADIASRDGPLSSEQILHPEKFWDAERRDPPTVVAPFDFKKTLGRKWKRTAFGNLGELMIGVMVGAPTPPGLAAMATPKGSDWTNAAAEGWDGDRWEIWRRGESSVVVLSTVWDSARDAEEFVSALDPDAGLRYEVRGARVAVVAVVGDGDADIDAQGLLDAVLGSGG